jgi:hypothetical protein
VSSVRLDPSGWTTYMQDDGSMRAEVVLTRRAQTAMSARQLADFLEACRLMSRAFTPDEPVTYAPHVQRVIDEGIRAS